MRPVFLVASESWAPLFLALSDFFLVFISNCSFISNAAANGGAIGTQFPNGLGRVNVSDCFFVENSATMNGGAVYSPDIPFEVTRCQFSRNQAAQGGAVFSSSFIIISDSVFDGNVANADGVSDLLLFPSRSSFIFFLSF
jgi:predicted outer membrane repeat protein